jgi:transcription elongation factor Elf1
MLRCPMCGSRKVTTTATTLKKDQMLIDCLCQQCGRAWAMLADSNPRSDTDKKPHKRR